MSKPVEVLISEKEIRPSLQYHLGEALRLMLLDPEIGSGSAKSAIKLEVQYDKREPSSEFNPPKIVGIIVTDHHCRHTWDLEGFNMLGPTRGCSACGTWEAD